MKGVNIMNLNESFEDEIVNAYKQGMQISDIVKKFSVSKYLINQIAVKHNLEKRSVFHYKREPIIKELWDAGERDINVLAEKAMCTTETVKNALKKINPEFEKDNQKKQEEEKLKRKKRVTINIGDTIAYGFKKGYLNRTVVVEKIENGFAICKAEKGSYLVSFTAFELAKMFEKGEAEKIQSI